MSLIVAIDESVNTALASIRTPVVHNLFWLISFTIYLAVLATLVYFFLIKPNSHKKKNLECIWTGIKYPFAWVLLASYTALYLILSVIKQYASRIRPDGSDWLSFPSRHATFAFFIAITFPTKNKNVKRALYGWAALICISRLVLAEHWLSDVVFGAGLGLLTGFGFKYVFERKKQ